MAEYVEVEFRGEDKLSHVADRVKRSLNDVSDAGRGLSHTLGGALSGAVAGLTASLTTLATSALASVVNGVASSVRSFADFEGGLLTLRAVSGATADQMDRMKERALELGESTRFSAREALDAMIALAKGGVQIETVLGDASQAALDLAAASGVDLAAAAELVAKQLAVWGDRGVNAAQVATVLTSAANASTTSVGQLRYGLASLGAVARDFGLSFEESVTALAAVVPVASSAQDAGTSLRVALQRLASPTKEMRRLMQQLGISLFDQQGRFVGLAELAEQLNRAFAGMSDEMRASVATELGGADAVRSLLQLASLGRAGIEQLQSQMSALGGASEQAAAMNRGLSFALDELGAKFETLSIRVGEKIAPIVTHAAGVIGGAVDAVAQFVAALQLPESVGDALTSIVAAITGMSVEQAAADLAWLQSVFVSVGDAVRTTVLPAIEQHLAPAIADAIPVVQELARNAFATLRDMLTALAPILADAARVFAGVVVPAVGLVIRVVTELLRLLAQLIPVVRDGLTEAFRVIVPVVSTVAQTISDTVGRVIQWVTDQVMNLRASIASLHQSIQPVLQILGAGGAGGAGANIGMTAGAGLVTEIGRAFGAAVGEFDRAVSRLAGARGSQQVSVQVVSASSDYRLIQRVR